MARTSRSSRTDTIAVSDEAALTASTRSTSPAVSKKRPLETDAAPSARLAKRAKASTSSSVRPKRSKAKAEPIGTPSLVEEWRELSCKTLPAAAQAKDDAQSKWPVWVDHCFSRIILDLAVGKTQPWMDVLRAPAYKNMDDDQLRAAITLGKDILEGRASLVELNDRSLKLRGKTR